MQNVSYPTADDIEVFKLFNFVVVVLLLFPITPSSQTKRTTHSETASDMR